MNNLVKVVLACFLAVNGMVQTAPHENKRKGILKRRSRILSPVMEVSEDAETTLSTSTTSLTFNDCCAGDKARCLLKVLESTPFPPTVIGRSDTNEQPDKNGNWCRWLSKCLGKKKKENISFDVIIGPEFVLSVPGVEANVSEWTSVLRRVDALVA